MREKDGEIERVAESPSGRGGGEIGGERQTESKIERGRTEMKGVRQREERWI